MNECELCKVTDGDHLTGCPNAKTGDLSDSAQAAGSVPACTKCGNNRQVWVNQITGRLTCHRAFCHTDMESFIQGVVRAGAKRQGIKYSNGFDPEKQNREMTSNV